MSNPNETIADIVAEMRGIYIREWQDFADRIEAAYKRENHCEKRFDKDGDEMPPHCAFDDLKIDRLQGKVKELEASLGNGLKMRKALESVRGWMVRANKEELDALATSQCIVTAKSVNNCAKSVIDGNEFHIQEIDAALAESPRNCDRFASGSEALEGFEHGGCPGDCAECIYNGGAEVEGNCKYCEVNWLFAKADGKDGAK